AGIRTPRRIFSLATSRSRALAVIGTPPPCAALLYDTERGTPGRFLQFGLVVAFAGDAGRRLVRPGHLQKYIRRRVVIIPSYGSRGAVRCVRRCRARALVIGRRAGPEY